MSSTFFKELAEQAESGIAAAAIDKGDYDTAVVSSRANAKSNQVFVTLRVLNGPLQGKDSDVSIWFPTPESKPGARMYFIKKVSGFMAYPDVKAAFAAADSAPSPEAGFQLIADALLNKQVHAEIGMRTEGEYAGTNELISTKTIDAGPVPSQTATFVAPAAQPVQNGPAPAPVSPF